MNPGIEHLRTEEHGAFQEELLRLRNQVEALAHANAEAAELMAQVEEAHRLEAILRTNNAQLERAHRQEERRAHFLEYIAQNRPVEELVSAWGRILSPAEEPLAYSILLARHGTLSHVHSGGMAEELVAAAQTADFSALPGIPEAAAARQPAMAHPLANLNTHQTFTDKLCEHGYETMRCWPVTNGASRLLALVVLYRPLGSPPVNAGAGLQGRFRLLAMALDHRAMTDRLRFQAHHDELTSLPNRLYFHERLQEAMDADRHSGKKVAILWADLDRFKRINDALGRVAGDLFLQAAGQRFRDTVQARGIVARIGGDQFAVLLPEIDTQREAEDLAQDLVEAFREPFGFEDKQTYIHVSIGATVFPDHAGDGEGLVCNADLALQRAKHNGRNSYVCYTPEPALTEQQSIQVEFHLHSALENHELEVLFQPLVSSADGTIECLETLLRWSSPNLGPVSPTVFIPVAEATGVIHKIGRWVLKEACRHAAEWQSLAPGVRVAVNVSPVQLLADDFKEAVEQALRDSGLAPHLLELELTEGAMISMSDYQRHTREFRALGVSLAIDDFGTGYSSLSSLSQLEVDALKIDQSFVKAVGKEPALMRLAEAILSMAKSLGLRVVAEGVETEEQLRWLTDLGCDLLQGYFLYRPMAPGPVPRVLLRRHPALSPAEHLATSLS